MPALKWIIIYQVSMVIDTGTVSVPLKGFCQYQILRFEAFLEFIEQQQRKTIITPTISEYGSSKVIFGRGLVSVDLGRRYTRPSSSTEHSECWKSYGARIAITRSRSLGAWNKKNSFWGSMLKSDFREGFIFGPISWKIIENAYVTYPMLRICNFHVILAEPL